jgi:AcrR family transcriptional regulator
MSALLDSRKDSKRLRIFEAAKRHFSHYGIKGTTMQDVAREAEIAVGTIYQFFPDKDALILAWIEEHRQLLQSQLAEITQQALPADEKLREFLRVRFETVAEVREKPAIEELTRAAIRLAPQVVTEMTATAFNHIREILEEGRRTGCLPSAEPRADAEILMLSLSGFFTGTPDCLLPIPTEEMMLRVVDWFIAKWKLPRPKPQS